MFLLLAMMELREQNLEVIVEYLNGNKREGGGGASEKSLASPWFNSPPEPVVSLQLVTESFLEMVYVVLRTVV
jgi:hypothetical protein